MYSLNPKVDRRESVVNQNEPSIVLTIANDSLQDGEGRRRATDPNVGAPGISNGDAVRQPPDHQSQTPDPEEGSDLRAAETPLRQVECSRVDKPAN